MGEGCLLSAGCAGWVLRIRPIISQDSTHLGYPSELSAHDSSPRIRGLRSFINHHPKLPRHDRETLSSPVRAAQISKRASRQKGCHVTLRKIPRECATKLTDFSTELSKEIRIMIEIFNMCVECNCRGLLKLTRGRRICSEVDGLQQKCIPYKKPPATLLREKEVWKI